MKTTIDSRFLALIAALAFTAGAPAAVLPPERLLPDDTLAMITVPDAAKMRAAADQSPMSKLWNDPAMKPFKDKLMTKLRGDMIEPLERELGVKFDEYAALAQGQITMAVTANGWTGGKDGEPGVLLLLDACDRQPALVKALADFRKRWTQAGKTLRTEKVRDVEFMVVSLTTNDIPQTLKRLVPASKAQLASGAGDEEDAAPAGDGKKNELFIGRVDSLLILGSSLKSVERIVGRASGGSAPPLADQTHFQSCQAALFRGAQAFGWVNAKALVAALLKASEKPEPADGDEAAPPPGIQPAKVMEAVGLNALRNMAFAYQDSAEGPVLQFHLGAPEADRKGLLKILAGEAKEAAPPQFVPADAVKFNRWRMDGQKAWSTLTSALNEISPGIMGTVDFIMNTANEAGKQADEKFDLRRQLVDNLGDDIIAYQKKPRGTGLEQVANPPSITMIASRKPAEMVAALKVVFSTLAQSPKPPAEREFLGRKIHTVTVIGPTSPGGMIMHLSHNDNYVLAANDEALIEECLRSGENQPKALRELAGFMEASAKVTGPGTCFFAYENQLETQRASLEMLKQTVGGNPGGAAGSSPLPNPLDIGLQGAGIKDWFDFALLPPFEAISKYYHFTVIGGGANMDGLTLKVFAPTPPALKK